LKSPVIAVFLTLSFYLCIISLQAQTANSMFDSGCAKFKNKDYLGAIDEFTKVVNKSSYFYEAYLERARCYYALNQNDKAMADCNKSVEINPKYHQAFLFRGELNAEMNNSKAAFADYNKCLELRPEYVDALVRRSALFQKTGKTEDALKDLNKALEINFGDAQLFYQRAGLNKLLGKKQETINDLSNAIKNQPDFAQAYFERGILYEEQKNLKAALTDYNKAIELNIKTREVYQRRVDINYTSGNCEAAISDFTKLIVDFKIKDLQLQYKRGVCFYQTGKYEEALKDLSRVASLDRENESANLLIADISIKQGKPNGALLYFSRVITINPKNSEVREKRAKMYFDQKKYQLAIEDLNEAIKIKATSDDYYLRAMCKDMLKDKKGACDDLRAASLLGNEEAGKKISGYCD
jgi:tetratricopeptide (TPR) repeat protein